MTELEAAGVVEPPPPYIIFLVVFLFFMTGLLGFLICHLLKKKGYRCRTGDLDEEEDEEEEKLGESADEDNEDNQDTVEQILKCIIENEANMEAFNEMLGNHNICVRHDPRFRKESIGGAPPHFHTVHSGTDHNSCHLCAQVRSKKACRPSRTPRVKQRPGEQTVFSVGRFRVTHTDKKLNGGFNALAVSGDQLDQSQDSDDRKEGSYNLRSMFKEGRSPAESAKGGAANVGKRKKSVTIFGLRRGSDPIGIKVKEGTRMETEGIKFAAQQPPVVLEEPQQTDTEHSIKPASKPQSEPVGAQWEAKDSGSVHSLPIQGQNQAHNSNLGSLEQIKLVQSPKLHAQRLTPPPSGSTAVSVPTSLSALSDKTVNVDEFKKGEEAYSPGPVQTSTPIAPMPASTSGFTPAIATGKSEPGTLQGSSPGQTPSEPISSTDLELGSGAGAMRSLGSSPPSSDPNKTLLSVTSVKSPTSSLAQSPSPQSSSRKSPLKETGTASSPTLISHPKVLPDQEKLSPPTHLLSSLGKNASPLEEQMPSPTVVDPKRAFTSPSSPRMRLPVTQPDLQGDTVPKTEERSEKKRAGILKNAKRSPEAIKESGASPTGERFKDRPSSLSPSSPSFPTSPQGGRISSVTVVKASPDSKREFSVVTMVDEEPSSPVKGQKAETSEKALGLGEEDRSPASCEQRDISVGQSEGPTRETSGTKISQVSQEKEVMMEMEDIKGCKVAPAEEEKWATG
ncbi:unnamed protein product [Menidia menidia]|uniref:(Atlantic silverside) hypothetical protein n=1 Tax=Menidia menidia TaxID=238744 RepID=A0A8S4BJR9_9TELE|nr:unnamed protein product [Menidia menidia]